MPQRSLDQQARQIEGPHRRDHGRQALPMSVHTDHNLSVIVGHDGILIANGMPQSMDGESTGIWALGVYLNTDGVIKKMGHNHIHQVVARTPQGYIIIADFGGGILVTVSEGSETDKLIPLMRSITQLVSQ
jgi:predicted regulator of Ras-like GTPase activity (Roadblock/LC7/MglB family)